MRIPLRVAAFATLFVLVLSACTPVQVEVQSLSPTPEATVLGEEATPSPEGTMVANGTPVNGTPTSAFALQVQRQVGDLAQGMRRVYRQIPQATPEQQAQVAGQMSELMSETADFLGTLEPTVRQMDPEEQRQIQGSAKGMYTHAAEMAQLLGQPAPEATPQGQLDYLEQARRLMENMHDQMQAQAQPMSGEDPEALSMHMAEFMGEMNRMVDRTSPALDQLDTSGQQQLRNRLDRMSETVSDMLTTLGTQQ